MDEGGPSTPFGAVCAHSSLFIISMLMTTIVDFHLFAFLFYLVIPLFIYLSLFITPKSRYLGQKLLPPRRAPVWSARFMLSLYGMGSVTWLDGFIFKVALLGVNLLKRRLGHERSKRWIRCCRSQCLAMSHILLLYVFSTDPVAEAYYSKYFSTEKKKLLCHKENEFVSCLSSPMS